MSEEQEQLREDLARFSHLYTQLTWRENRSDRSRRALERFEAEAARCLPRLIEIARTELAMPCATSLAWSIAHEMALRRLARDRRWYRRLWRQIRPVRPYGIGVSA